MDAASNFAMPWPAVTGQSLRQSWEQKRPISREDSDSFSVIPTSKQNSCARMASDHECPSKASLKIE